MGDMPKAAIVGIGQTEFSKKSGRSELQLAAESIKLALDDAGLDASEIDGLVTFTLDGSDEVGLSRCLGFDNLKLTTRIPQGGAAAVATICHAMSAIASGVCEVVWNLSITVRKRPIAASGLPLRR